MHPRSDYREMEGKRDVPFHWNPTPDPARVSHKPFTSCFQAWQKDVFFHLHPTPDPARVTPTHLLHDALTHENASHMYMFREAVNSMQHGIAQQGCSASKVYRI